MTVFEIVAWLAVAVDVEGLAVESSAKGGDVPDRTELGDDGAALGEQDGVVVFTLGRSRWGAPSLMEDLRILFSYDVDHNWLWLRCGNRMVAVIIAQYQLASEKKTP